MRLRQSDGVRLALLHFLLNLALKTDRLTAELSVGKPINVHTCFIKSDTLISLIMKTHLVTTLKRNATKILAELEEDKTPVLITEHGKPAAYLVDVGTFENLQNRIRILEGIARGETAIKQGRVLTHTQAKRKMRRWLG